MQTKPLPACVLRPDIICRLSSCDHAELLACSIRTSMQAQTARAVGHCLMCMVAWCCVSLSKHFLHLTFLLDLQDAMRAAGKSGTEDCPVQMKLVAPPLYVLTTQTLDKNKGIQVLNDAIEVAEQTIKSHKGNFKVKEAPRTVSERDDLLLQSKVCSPY